MSPSGTTAVSEQRRSCGCPRSGTQAQGRSSFFVVRQENCLAINQRIFPQHPEPGVRHEAGSPQRVRGAAGEGGRHHQPVQVIIIIIIIIIKIIIIIMTPAPCAAWCGPPCPAASASTPTRTTPRSAGHHPYPILRQWEVGFVHGAHYNLFEFVESS